MGRAEQHVDRRAVGGRREHPVALVAGDRGGGTGRARGVVLEELGRAVGEAHERVEVAVAVEVGQERRGEVARRVEPERVRCPAGEGGRDARAGGVLEVDRLAVVVRAHDEVEVAVAVEVRDGGVGVVLVQRGESEGVGDRRGERGRPVRPAGVVEQDEVGGPEASAAVVAAAEEGVGVAVAVEVGELDGGVAAAVGEAEQVAAVDERRRGGRAGVLVVAVVAVGVADHEVEVAVAVDVAEVGREHAAEPGGVVEPDGGGRALGVGRRRRGAGVLEVVERAVRGAGAVVVAGDEVEVAVAVEVALGVGGGVAEVGQPEREGLGGREGGRLTADRRRRRRRRGVVLEVKEAAVVLAGEHVRVAVAVEVGHSGLGLYSNVGQAERVRLLQREGWCAGGTGVLEVAEVAAGNA